MVESSVIGGSSMVLVVGLGLHSDLSKHNNKDDKRIKRRLRLSNKQANSEDTNPLYV